MISGKNVGIITQARMTSTRLPGKIMMLANGKSMLEYHRERLKWSGIPLYIATTINDTDNPVVDFAKEHNIPVCRGSEDNVLSRYYECAKANELDIIIRVTSDCPLIDGHLIRQGLDKYLEINDKNLYLSNSIERTYARGFDYEIFSFELLEDAYLKADKESELEHVTPYIRNNVSGSVKVLNIASSENNGKLRITLDTVEDYELIRRLFEDYQAESLDFEEITDILRMHPELVSINAHIEQKKVG